MALRRHQIPARAKVVLLQSDPELWGVDVVRLGVIVAVGDELFLDTSRSEQGEQLAFKSEKKLLKWLKREKFSATDDWQFWERIPR